MTAEPRTNPEVGHTVVADGIRTNYHDLGSGPPVVFIHGSGPGVSAWANWRFNLTPLSSQLRVLAPDIVGFGYTARPKGIRYTLDTWVYHLTGFLDALDLPRVSLLGNSFGGALTLAFATRYPDRVDHIVLMGSVGTSFPVTPGLDEAWGYRPSRENMRRLLDLFAYDHTLVSDEIAQTRYEASTRPGVQEAYEAMFPAPRQRWIDALATSPDKIQKLDHSALIIHGREDRIIPMSSSLQLFDLIPRSRLHVFGHCGHWTQIEHATEFNNLLADFLVST